MTRRELVACVVLTLCLTLVGGLLARHLTERGAADMATESSLSFYTIYTQRTLDYPGRFPVRRFEIGPGRVTPRELLGAPATLEEARKLVPPGLTRMPPSPQDDPVVLETWA